MSEQIITIEKFDFNKHQEIAQQAIDLQTSESPQMLPFSLESFSGYPLGAIAHIAMSEFVGFNAVIQEYPNYTCEIGGLYIAPQFRGVGITWPLKAELWRLMQVDYTGWRAITFTNPTSQPINRKLGFEEATVIPEEALALCASCSKKSKLPADQICCDVILEHHVN